MNEIDEYTNVYAKLYEALIAADNLSYKPNNQQPNMKTNLQTKTDYIIGSIAANGQYSFSKEPRSHSTEQSATTEAHRLASTVATDKQFVVFKRTLTPVKSAQKVPHQSEWL